MPTMRGKRVLTSLYLDPETAEQLKRLSETTRVPQAVYLREAVDLLLSHYRSTGDLIVGKKKTRTEIPGLPTLERFIRAAERLGKDKPPRVRGRHK